MKIEKLTQEEYNKLGKTIQDMVEAEERLDTYVKEYDLSLLALSCMINNIAHNTVLKKMLEERKDTVDLDKKIGSSLPIFVAIMNNNYNAIRILIAHGANPNLQDENGDTIVHHATRMIQEAKVDKDVLMGQHQLNQILTFDNVDLSIKNNNGQTAEEEAEDKYNVCALETYEEFHRRNKWGDALKL